MAHAASKVLRSKLREYRFVNVRAYSCEPLQLEVLQVASLTQIPHPSPFSTCLHAPDRKAMQCVSLSVIVCHYLSLSRFQGRVFRYDETQA